MRIQIVDVGNTHTKFGDFEVNDKGKVDLLDYKQAETPRENPYDLLEVVKEISDTPGNNPDTFMINSFSGAFIYGDEWYFADKEVEPFESKDIAHEMFYWYTGQNDKFGLVGLPALLKSVDTTSDLPPETPHGWLLRKLFNIPPRWDITHASRSGLYNLQGRRWCHLPNDLHVFQATRQLLGCPVVSCGEYHTTDWGMRVLTGGLDHSFISSYLTHSYVASGTWCNIIQAEPHFYPNVNWADTIRWGILADGRYAKEIVFPVDRSDDTVFEEVKRALPKMHMTGSVALTGGSADKVRPMLEEKCRMFYDLQGGFPHLEMKSAAYFAWRCSL